MKIRINHPMADMVSVISGGMAYAGNNSSELAFFQGGEWVVDPLPEFAMYHDGSTEDSAVYPWVPNDLIESFLAEYRR